MPDLEPTRAKRRVQRHSDDVRRHALQVIASTGGNLAAAARILANDASLLHRWQKDARRATPVDGPAPTATRRGP